MNKITLTILSALTATLIYAQAKFPGGSPGYFTPNPSSFVDVPAPEAASLGKYGDVGVSYFTGNPNISIPLYNLTVRDVNMPITLDYESSGVRVNNLPTWAGQNWTLNVGGVITRIVKGRYDEWIYPRQMQLPDAVNYFQCHDKLKELLGKNDNYKSLKNAAVYNYHDLAPDEYTFHFMGKSGKFFLDDTGSWRVQSDDNLEVIFDYNKSTNFISPLFAKYPKTTALDKEQRKTIAGFVIRDAEGNCYQFGYDRNAIEYTTNFWHMSRNEENESWHAQSWYLSKVTDKYGNVLFKLHYDRGAYVIQVFNGYFRDEVKEKARGFFAASMQYSVSNSTFPYTFSICSPVYLKKITTLSGMQCEFSSSYVSDEMATEKLYKKVYDGMGSTSNFYQKMASMVSSWGPYSGTGTYHLGAFYYLHGDEEGSSPDSISRFRYNRPSEDRFNLLSYARIKKLNNVVISATENKLSEYIGFRFCMSYVNNRLKLDSLMVQDHSVHYSDKTGVKGVYRFTYNNFENLPNDYLTTKEDHWGFYNGVSYYQAVGIPKSNLEIVRNPNSTYTQIGMLSSIQYPTGGVMDFVYEPNTYSRYLTHDRQSMVEENGIGGGLRIKTINLYESPSRTRLLKVRDFSYNIPGTGKSSGELFATPLYDWDGWRIKCINNATYHLSTLHTTSVVPLANSFGASLGYSYVTETIRDLSSTGSYMDKHVYRFSNLSDPTVCDQRFYLTFGYADGITPYDEYSELGFKRGRLLSETTYDGDGTKISSTGYKFRSDNFLDNHHVLTSNLQYECYGNSSQYAHYVGGIYKLYYPKYDIVEKHDTVFSTDGSAPLITCYTYGKTDKDYTSWYGYYHGVNMRLTETETVRRGSQYEKNTYVYGDFNNCSVSDSILYKCMSVIQPLSVINERNNQTVSETKTIYKELRLNGKRCMVPSMVTLTNNYQKIDTLVTYTSYTSTGMPAQFRELGKPTTFLKWAVNDSYLVMKSDGYIPYSVSDANFYDRQKGYSQLYNWVKNSSNMTTGYVYNPLFGVTSIISSNGKAVSFKYDSFGRLVEETDENGNLLRQYQYNIRK